MFSPSAVFDIRYLIYFLNIVVYIYIYIYIYFLLPYVVIDFCLVYSTFQQICYLSHFYYFAI